MKVHRVHRKVESSVFQSINFFFSRFFIGYWKDTKNQRQHLEWVGKQLGVSHLDDWYKFASSEVRKRAPFISTYHRSSLYEALKNLFPEHNWNPSRFKTVPKGHWSEVEAQREHLNKVGKELGVTKLDDWYKFTSVEFRKRALFINKYYNGSLPEALQHLYPEHNWDPLLFQRPPRGHWKSEHNQREHLNKLGKELGVRDLDDWYKFSSQVVSQRAPFIGNYYKGSLYNVLKHLYPEHDWNPLRFPMAPQGYWKKEQTKKYFQHLFVGWQQQHNIKRLQDWYALPPNNVKLIQRASYGIFGSMHEMLRQWFPNTNWLAELQGSTPELEIQVTHPFSCCLW